METGLLHDFFGNFSTRGEKYYFCMKGSMQDEIEPMHGKIETNIETDIEMNIPAGGGVPPSQPDGSRQEEARWGLE